MCTVCAGSGTEEQADIQSGRQTYRQTCRQTGSPTDGQTSAGEVVKTKRRVDVLYIQQADSKSSSQTRKQTKVQKLRHLYRQACRYTALQADVQANK